MKNLFRLSTGIVFIISILFAAGCSSEKITGDDTMVVIQIRLAKSKNGDKYLEMRDTLDVWVKDSLLETFVDPGDTIIWMFDRESGIKRIKNIKGSNGKIMKKQPTKKFLSKKFRLYLTDDLVEGDREEYYIEFKIPGDNTKHKTDPFLRVRPDPEP